MDTKNIMLLAKKGTIVLWSAVSMSSLSNFKSIYLGIEFCQYCFCGYCYLEGIFFHETFEVYLLNLNVYVALVFIGQ